MDTSTATSPPLVPTSMDDQHKRHHLHTTRIPKPFSIESIISSCASNADPPSTDSPPLTNTIFSTPSSLFPSNFCLPHAFQHSIYSPWMSYLASASAQQHQHQQHPPINHQHPAYHLFANSAERFTNLLDNPDRESHSLQTLFGPSAPHIDPRFALAAVDPEHREQLAQLFANNVRDPKLTEFLLGRGGIDIRARESRDYYAAGKDEERSGVDAAPKHHLDHGEIMAADSFGHNRVGRVRDLSELYYRGQRMLNGDRTGSAAPLGGEQLDMDSAESSSELSMRMSPDGERKSAGNNFLLN